MEINGTKQIFIAEVKTESPFGWESNKSWDELFEVANEYGDWLSIHTDYRWGGSFDLLRRARERTNKPILAKGIHTLDEEIEAAIDCGADHVLVVGRLPGVHIGQCLIEPLDQYELKELSTNTKAVWNRRDLGTGTEKFVSFEQAREVWPGWLAQASFIEKIADIDPAADAFIVGTHLLQFVADFQK